MLPGDERPSGDADGPRAWNEPGIIGKVLDGGAYGVICPMINTPQEAKNLVAFSKYPPKVPARTARSVPACTLGWQLSADPTTEIVLLPMMETKTAVENMESILDVEGTTGVYIGPSDLGFSYGLVPKLDRDEPEFSRSMRRSSRSGKRGLYPGIHCSGADGGARHQHGLQARDAVERSGLMQTYARMQVNQTRKESGGKAKLILPSPRSCGRGRVRGLYP